MVIKPMIRNNICMNAHPVGCFKDVEDQIRYVKDKGSFKGGKKALIIGCSTGYGLASRISLAFGSGAGTLGISFEKEPSEKKTGTMGWYNNASFEKLAKAEGLVAETINADAFSHETRKETIDKIKELFGTVDVVVYSLASPVRTDPDTGIQYRSVLKPIGKVYSSKTLNTSTDEVCGISVDPVQDEEEIANTVKVMGGEDWILWIKALQEAQVLAPGAITIAYSYIGPELTYAVYRDGTIGKAKEHLEASVAELDAILQKNSGKAYVSVNKGLVTRASSVIPVVPLYFALLYKVMKAKGLHEGCIEQMDRLYRGKVYSKGNGTSQVELDAEGRIRMDDWELKDEVQAEVSSLWEQVNTDNVKDLADVAGYHSDFLTIHGFGRSDVDYDAEVSSFYPLES